ncbi:MAG TPA: hypothetical protein VGB77_21245 [Abditibacteriaceae bacterium]
MRFIRMTAFCAAIGLSLCFLPMHLMVLSGPRFGNGVANVPYKIAAFFAIAAGQIIFLLPCWRAWLLHRWACSLLTYVLLIASVGALVSTFWLGIIGFLLTATLLVALDEEQPSLKSGF